MGNVLDSHGLVRNNEHLTVYFPNNNKAFVFRVVSRHNKGYETMDYGSIPITTSDTLTSYDGGTATPAANGFMPARSYTGGEQFTSTENVYDTADMWYTPYQWNDRVFHIKMAVTPAWIRVGLQIPTGVNQTRFQRERVVTGVDKGVGMGYRHGAMETVQFPEFHYGWVFGNDTNLALNTSVKFTYGEYLVKIPNNPEFIYSALINQTPTHWVNMPMTVADSTITQGLIKTWGFDGFPVYSILRRQEAVQMYTQILSNPDVVSKGVLG